MLLLVEDRHCVVSIHHPGTEPTLGGGLMGKDGPKKDATLTVWLGKAEVPPQELL